MPRDTRSRINALLRQLEPRVRRAFEDAIGDMRQTAPIGDLTRALERRDIDEAVRLLQIDVHGLRLEEALAGTFQGGGDHAVDNLPARNPATGDRIVARFSGRHERAERWIREHSGQMITRISADAREVVRETLEAGLVAGRNPNATALDLVGRVNKRTGRRTGGVIGLDTRRAGWVRDYRAALVGEGRPADQVERMVARRANKLLRQRGATVARTETIAAMNAGRSEALEQLIERGTVDRDAVTLTWSSTGDSRTRDPHLAMNGQQVRHGQAFRSPTGAELRFPGDTELGAGGEDVINCRCTVQQSINWYRGLR